MRQLIDNLANASFELSHAKPWAYNRGHKLVVLVSVYASSIRPQSSVAPETRRRDVFEASGVHSFIEVAALIAVQSAAEARIALSTRGRAKRQQRALRASLRGAALTARARQRSEAGRASASISSNHALFTLSPPGHGLAAGGSHAGPQDSVRRPRAKHITAAIATRCRPTDAGPRNDPADAAAALRT